MKTKLLFNTIALIGLCLLPFLGQSQTVNTGELYVTPNTQFSTVGEFQNLASGTFINDGEAFIYNHFSNEGTVDFTDGEEGLTRFQGTAVQQLSGGNISYFYDVLFDNTSSTTASFELSSEVSIGNEVNFREGIVKNDDFGGLMIFENNADHTGTYDGSHVDGQVQKDGDDTFQFPIGDGGFFRYATISAPDNTDDVFTAKYFFENPDTNYPLSNRTGVIELIDDQEYWIVTRDSGNSTVLLTLSWEEGTTTPQEIVNNPLTSIHIVRWDETLQLWVDEGGAVNPANKTVTTPLRLDDYGVFTLARVNESIILPGDVIIYNGVTPNGDGKNDYFIIENIQNLANNHVQIFNRWGVEVFETSDYDTNGNVFDGYSEGRLTINQSNRLPTGTYYYILTYDYDNNGTTERIKKAGYLYLTTE